MRRSKAEYLRKLNLARDVQRSDDLITKQKQHEKWNDLNTNTDNIVRQENKDYVSNYHDIHNTGREGRVEEICNEFSLFPFDT